MSEYTLRLDQAVDEREELKARVAALEAECERLREALKALTNEASGFIGMADMDRHGYTNMQCLRRRIHEAKAALDGTAQEAKHD